MQKFEFKLDHARHNASHCLAPGLFRALKRGERRTTKLDVVYQISPGQKIEFSGPEPLGADDLRVLQGLVALGGPEGKILTPTPKKSTGIELRQLLELRWGATSEDAIVVEASYRRLAKEIGYSQIDCIKPIKVCIERLWKVSVIVQYGNQRRGFRLLADYRSDSATQGFHIALNPLLADSIFGKQRHIRISMAEVRALKGEAARLIHQRLCGWINPGSSRTVQLSTLCEYVFPTKASASTTRKRLSRIRLSLEELRAIGWTITEYSKGRFEILRPHINSHAPHTNCHKVRVNSHTQNAGSSVVSSDSGTPTDLI